MSKKSLNIITSKNLFDQVICNVNKLPFSFIYNNVFYNSLTDYSLNENEDDNYINKEYVSIIEKTIKITYTTIYNKEFGECEYFVYFENISNTTSKEISNLVSFDYFANGKNPKVSGCYGDLTKFYESYEYNLTHNDLRFAQKDGRSCHINFPYFNFSFNNEGLILCLGWAGTWETLFTNDGYDKTRIVMKNNLDLNTSLLPQEKIRSARIVLLPYKGDEADSTNLYREWFVKYNMPRLNKNNDKITPFSTCMLANDTGVKNLDGSVSENCNTWKVSIDKLVKEKLVTDYRWIDAGWYCDDDNWWGNVGAYTLSNIKWPHNSFKDAVSYCHHLNMKTFLWFEPERVGNIDLLINKFNYQKKWAIETPQEIYNNIGNVECFNWTLNQIIKVLDENDIDMYREDENLINPKNCWNTIDQQEESILKIKRKGINENKCVLAHYNLLKEIIAYQLEHNKNGFVDICAGGGGRNDIESLRYGIPIMRSDIDRGSSSMRLSQTSSLCKWIVFHGSSTKESDDSYKLLETKGSTPYVARASYLPIYNINEAFTHNVNLDYDMMRKNFNEWKSINHLLTKDYYLLTPFHHNTNKYSWTVFCYDDNMLKESVLLGFRMENSSDSTYLVKLPFVDKNEKYEIYDVDLNKKTIVSGNALKDDGLILKLDHPKSSILLKIKQI